MNSTELKKLEDFSIKLKSLTSACYIDMKTGILYCIDPSTIGRMVCKLNSVLYPILLDMVTDKNIDKIVFIRDTKLFRENLNNYEIVDQASDTIFEYYKEYLPLFDTEDWEVLEFSDDDKQRLYKANEILDIYEDVFKTNMNFSKSLIPTSTLTNINKNLYIKTLDTDIPVLFKKIIKYTISNLDVLFIYHYTFRK